MATLDHTPAPGGMQRTGGNRSPAPVTNGPRDCNIRPISFAG